MVVCTRVTNPRRKEPVGQRKRGVGKKEKRSLLISLRRRRWKNARVSFSHDVIYARNFGTRRLKTLRLFCGKPAAERCPENFNFANKNRTFIKPNYSPFLCPVLGTVALVTMATGLVWVFVLQMSRKRRELVQK